MEASKLFAGFLAVLTAGLWSFSQAAGSPAPQSSSQSSSQPSAQDQGHRPVHHIRVEDDDAPAQPPELTQAEAAIEKRNYAAAEPLLHKLVARDAGNYVAWFDLGFVENELGNVEASIAAYRKSVAAKPDVFEANLNLGLQLARTGQPDAEDFLRAATHLTPTSHAAEGQYRAWVALGHTLENESKAEEALSAYQRAAILQPKEIEPHLSAGQVLEHENKFAEAEKEYQQALALDPSSTDAVIGLANIYMRGHRFPQAEDYLRKLLAANPESGAAEIQLGRVLAAEGKPEDGIAALAAGLKLTPGDDSARRDLAELYATAGKSELAEGAYRALVAAHPNEAELHRRLGQALLRQKKFPEAQQEFVAAVKLKPDLGEAYGDLAFAADENQQYELVVRALDARAKLLPEIPITYFLRASACDHLHDVKAAALNYHLFLNTAKGKYPDQEWQAKHRLIAIEPKK